MSASFFNKIVIGTVLHVLSASCHVASNVASGRKAIRPCAEKLELVQAARPAAKPSSAQAHNDCPLFVEERWPVPERKEDPQDL